MKLAKKALVLTLTMLTLIFAVSAQKSENDPRNTAPTVGTGGPVGGPTGLFTVYDGHTLQKGEYTFSIAYSNFDRDPGDVDIVEIPLSFQFGLTNNFEIFFNTDAYRAVNVNSQRNISGFYLPNSLSGSLPAIVLGPQGPNASLFGNRAVFRPPGQPFAQFPFVGASAGLYGFDIFNADPSIANVARASLAAAFGFPNGTIPSLGPVGAGGVANIFTGIGSVYGGILPGVVLQTRTIGQAANPGAGNPGIGTQVIPTVFSLAPSYLPDAPLLNRGFGESAFSTFTVGGKWRFTSNSNPIGAGIIPFYRFYNDNADDFAGFNQLQRGASPGGNRGDFGLIGFADSRLRKWLNVSANFGYIYNSDIKGNVGGTNVTLLDRPDELISAIGVDFPVNKHFQPILEVRSLQYVGGRTPNAFENSPIDVLAGVRVFAKRWVGFSAAYRYHANQQSRGSLENNNFNGSVTIGVDPRLQTGTPVAPVVTNFRGVPPGFRTSTDPHGFMVQGFIGRRNSRAIERKNIPAKVTGINLSQTTISLGCKPGFKSTSGGCRDDKTVNVRTSASDDENDPLTYNYTVSGGRIVGQGANVSWDLSGVGPGSYTVTAGVDDGCGVCGDTKTATVTVQECQDCVKDCDCPTSVDVPDAPVAVAGGENLSFTASVVGGSQDSPTYNWSVDKGSIISGQGTSTITVSTDGLNDTTVKANVTVGGLCDSCTNNTDSGTGIITAKPTPVFITEIGKVPADTVRAEVDQFFIELQNRPNATGYIVNYGSARDVAKREKLIKNHMTLRSFPQDRMVFVKGGVESQIRTRLWVVPVGADSSTVK